MPNFHTAVLMEEDSSNPKLPNPKKADGLDDIKIEQFLGSGSFGYVFQATGHNLGRHAVKIIFPELNAEHKEKKRILREYDILNSKHHKNIVRTFESAERSFSQPYIQKWFKSVKLSNNDAAMCLLKSKRVTKIDTICIQMELCGHTLRQWLNKRPFTLSLQPVKPTQVEIAQGIIDGLGFLHLNQILHRDLKPENIYFSSKYLPPVKIGDFGLSSEVNTNSSGIDLGTALYRAPETVFKRYTMQADLFSLGLVIWEVVQLIKTDDRKRLFGQLVYDEKCEVVIEHGIIRNSRDLIVHLTKRRVEDRTRSIKEVKLNCHLDNVNASDPLLEIIYQRKPTRRRGSKTFWAFVFCAFVTSFVLGFIAVFGTEGFIRFGAETRENLSSLSKSSEQNREYLKLENTVHKLNEGVHIIKLIDLLPGAKLTGQGVNATVLKTGGIHVLGNYTEISGMQIEPLDLIQEESPPAKLLGHLQQPNSSIYSVSLAGDHNVLSQVRISNFQAGVKVVGNLNRVVNVTLYNVGEYGMSISGNENEIDFVNVSSPRTSIIVRGEGNKFTNPSGNFYYDSST